MFDITVQGCDSRPRQQQRALSRSTGAGGCLGCRCDALRDGHGCDALQWGEARAASGPRGQAISLAWSFGLH